jgi:FkbM family methyltransferase
LAGRKNKRGGGLKDALRRKILNLALGFVKRHVSRQEGISLYKYDRLTEELSPLVWRARGVTQSGSAKDVTTNNWSALDDLIAYDGLVVVDIGANSGQTARKFSEKASTVFAVEPHPGNFTNLQDQIKIRQIRNIRPFQLAISSEPGTASLFERESHGIHSLGVHNRGKVLSELPVEVMTLDGFWGKYVNERIGLLKVDVEGFETEVFEGARDLLEQKKIDAIVFEFSPRIHKMRGLDEDAPLKVLERYGYDVFDEMGKPFEYSGHDAPALCDLVARPRS